MIMAEVRIYNKEKINCKENHNEAETDPLNSQCLREENGNAEEFKSLFGKINYIKSCITVEPVLGCFIIPSVISALATQNLNLDKACRVNLNFSDEVCDALKIRNATNFRHEEMEVQKLIASIQAWKTILQTSLPLLLITFMGAWSDRTGRRKICILLPIAGEIMVCVSNLLNTYYFYEIPVEVTMFLEGLFPALSGGMTMLILGIFSYISDITTIESRTFRVGVVNLCLTAGMPVGTALSGVMVKYIGFYGVFSTCGILYVLNFLYTLFVLKEPERLAQKKTESCWSFKAFFDLSNLKQTLTVVFKKRDHNTRMKIIIVLTVIAIIYGPNHGEHSVQYIYTRFRFNWDAVDYSMYSTFHVITHTLGALFSISLFSRRLGCDDSVLGLISVVSKFFGCIMKAAAMNGLQMYMVALVEILNATTFTSLRSIASKLVSSEEMGKINSMLSLVETFAALCYDPVYAWLYMLTLPVLPGAVFIFSAVMTVPPTAIFLWLYMQHRKGLSKREEIWE